MRTGSCLLLAACAVFAAACATNPVSGKKQVSLLSEAEELAIGREQDAQIRQEMGVYGDRGLEQYVSEIGQELARNSHRPNLPWSFTIVDNAAINAFALPGGYVYVTRGILAYLDDESELAGVLGHEIGHVVKRHSIKQMQQAQGANVGVTLACVLTRICESQAGQAAIQVGGTALFAKFSRADETEADEEGIQNVVRAGISPNGIPEMFQILLNERQSNPSAVEGWFATHPMEEDRIANTRAIIAQINPAVLRTLSTDSQRYQQFKARIRSLPPSPTPRASR